MKSTKGAGPKQRRSIEGGVVVRRFFSAVLSLLLVHAGVAPAFARSSDARPRYDAEVLYRGLFFGQGPVAKLFPEIWERAEVSGHVLDESPEKTAAITRTMARLQAENPAFLPHFAAEVQSGDHMRIQSAIDQGARLLLAAAQLDAKGSPDPNAQPAFFWMDAYVAAYLYVVVVIAVATVLVLAHAPENGETASLEREMYVDQIALRLGPQGATPLR